MLLLIVLKREMVSLAKNLPHSQFTHFAGSSVRICSWREGCRAQVASKALPVVPSFMLRSLPLFVGFA